MTRVIGAATNGHSCHHNHHDCVQSMAWAGISSSMHNMITSVIKPILDTKLNQATTICINTHRSEKM